MSSNKTQPTTTPITSFLETVRPERQEESATLIAMMQEITSEPPVLWGPSIIGFGTQHYRYESGREGDMPRLAFSPRKASITIYFDRFDQYGEQLARLGTYKTSVSCLYIRRLSDIDLSVLREMLALCHKNGIQPAKKPENVAEYLSLVPAAARPQFDQLRSFVRSCLPEATEVLSYGILGYSMHDTRALVYISGWKDHVALYPIPKDPSLQSELQPYARGKGTIWFSLDEPLPKDLIKRVVAALQQDAR